MLIKRQIETNENIMIILYFAEGLLQRSFLILSRNSIYAISFSKENNFHGHVAHARSSYLVPLNVYLLLFNFLYPSSGFLLDFETYSSVCHLCHNPVPYCHARTCYTFDNMGQYKRLVY